MPYRKVPLVTNHIYHIYNQGIDRRVTYSNKREYEHALTTLWFYQYDQHFIKLAHYLSSGSAMKGLKEEVEKSPKLVDILAFCLMPNHFHFMLFQRMDRGISRFMADFQNSYTKYFNAKHERRGPLFLSPFRALRAETDEQLLHLGRYIHLNTFSSGVTSTMEGTINYPYSSLSIYLGRRLNTFNLKTELLSSYFPNIEKHQQFIEDQADYQKQLESIKHLTQENEI